MLETLSSRDVHVLATAAPVLAPRTLFRDECEEYIKDIDTIHAFL